MMDLQYGDLSTTEIMIGISLLAVTGGKIFSVLYNKNNSKGEKKMGLLNFYKSYVHSAEKHVHSFKDMLAQQNSVVESVGSTLALIDSEKVARDEELGSLLSDFKLLLVDFNRLLENYNEAFETDVACEGEADREDKRNAEYIVKN